jgi:PST family polysaccharide transporter
MILAPILGPRPYGLFSIVMVFVGFCEFVLSEGAIEALVTVDELDSARVYTANLANSVLAVVLSLLLFALAPTADLLFPGDQIHLLIWALTPLPILTLLSVAPVAMLRRSLQYKRLAIRSIVGLAAGGVAGIALAIGGAGVWALVAQAVVQRSVETAVVWISSPVRFGFGWSRMHFLEMNHVALNVFAARVMTFASGQLPRLVLGYMIGPTELGLFTLANRFLDIIIYITVLPRAAIGRIELRALQPGLQRFTKTFSRMIQDASLVSFPALLGAAAIMPDLFKIWLDHRWLPGVTAAQLVLLSGLSLALSYCIDAALLGAKLSNVFKWTATLQAATTVATVLIVAQWGLDITCLALAIRPLLLLPIILIWLHRYCGLSVSLFAWPLLRSLIGALIMVAVLSLPFLRQPWFQGRLDLIILVLTGAICYGAFAYGFARTQVKELFAAIFTSRT